MGKTRLAFQIAADLADRFVDGVWVVELASVDDPSLVATRVADALGLRRPTRSTGSRSRTSSSNTWPGGTCCSCWTTASRCSPRARTGPPAVSHQRRACTSWRRAGRRWASRRGRRRLRAASRCRPRSVRRRPRGLSRRVLLRRLRPGHRRPGFELDDNVAADVVAHLPEGRRAAARPRAGRRLGPCPQRRPDRRRARRAAPPARGHPRTHERRPLRDDDGHHRRRLSPSGRQRAAAVPLAGTVRRRVRPRCGQRDRRPDRRAARGWPDWSRRRWSRPPSDRAATACSNRSASTP